MSPDRIFNLLIESWIPVVFALVTLIPVAYLWYRESPKQKKQNRRVTTQPAMQPTLTPVRPIASVPVAMISYKELASEYDRLKARHAEAQRRIAARLAELRGRKWESQSVADLLAAASPQEREGLAAILKLQSDAPVTSIVEWLERAGSNATASQARKLRGLYPYVRYREVLTDVAKKLGVPKLAASSTDAEIEQSVVVAAFKTILEKATPEQRAALMAELSAKQAKMTQGLGVATSGLILANLSGFGLYVAASSALGALTSAIGVTLPFAVYTGMSSTIAAVIGPVGWVLLLVGGAVLVGGVDFKKTVPGVLAITTVRARLIAERDQEIAALNSELSGNLANQASKVQKLRALLDRMISEGLNAIPRVRVPQ